MLSEQLAPISSITSYSPKIAPQALNQKSSPKQTLHATADLQGTLQFTSKNQSKMQPKLKKTQPSVEKPNSINLACKKLVAS
jgi:hypothetical protein